MSACVRDRECESVCVLQIKTSVDVATSASRIICRPRPRLRSFSSINRRSDDIHLTIEAIIRAPLTGHRSKLSALQKKQNTSGMRQRTIVFHISKLDSMLCPLRHKRGGRAALSIWRNDLRILALCQAGAWLSKGQRLCVTDIIQLK